MDDQELEARLRAYRPMAPPPELRAAVVARRLPLDGTRGRQPSERSPLAWLPAVAALLLATVFYWLAANERRMLDAQWPAVAAESQPISMEFPQ